MTVLRTGYFMVGFGVAAVPSTEVLGGLPVHTATLTMKRKKPASLTLSWSGLKDETLLNSPLIAENKVIRWTLGYLPDRMSIAGPRRGEQLTGIYLIKKIQVQYKETGEIGLKLDCMDKGVKLSDDSAPDVFTNITLSETVREMAERVGLRSDVEESEIVHEHVVLGDGQTYAEKLIELANDEDFEFWIEEDTVYLRRARYQGPPTLTLGWRAFTASGQDGVYLKDFSTTADYKGLTGAKKRKSGGKDDEGKPTASTEDKPPGGGNQDGGGGFVSVQYNKGGGFSPATVANQSTPATPRDGIRTASPLKQPTQLAARNVSQTRFLGLKSQKCSGKLCGFLLRPRHFVSVVDVRRIDAVPWLVEGVKYEYKQGDLSVSFEGVIEPKTRSKGSRSGKTGKDGGDDNTGSSTQTGGGAGGKGAVRVQYLGPGATAVSTVTR